MRTVMKAAVLAVCFALLSACGPGTTTGAIYTDSTVPAPNALTDNPVVGESGEACATSILGIVTMGDASIKAAADDGNITQVGAVNRKVTSILGLYADHCTVVQGQ